MWVISTSLSLFWLNVCSQSEIDSINKHRLQEVNINHYEDQRVYDGPASIQIFHAKRIKQLPVLQLSDALKYMSGVVIKDYGGTGGMKTISVRGLGTQHTGVAYDEITISDCQTGQIDLSKLTLDNVGSLQLIVGADDKIFLPARLLSYSSLLKIKTVNAIPDKNFGLRVGGTIGLYGYYSTQAAIFTKIKSKKYQHRLFYWNLFTDLMRSKGDYPYIIKYGGANDSISREIRKNSTVHSCNIETNAVWQIDQTQRLNVKLYYYGSDRELPPATVFYSNNSHQKLWNRNAFVQVHYHNYFNKKWAYQVNAKANYDYTRYLDPEYLNEQGFLDNHYHQTEGYLSNAVQYTPIATDEESKKIRLLQFSLSQDAFIQHLDANSLNYQEPSRITSLSAISMNIAGNQWKITGNLLFTYVDNILKNVLDISDFSHLSPTVGASFKINKTFSLRTFYKNIFRMPTFNDLYYREVGNIYLMPEKTHQWNVGAVVDDVFVVHRKVSTSVTLDSYFNIVKDKIVAFPSHNLFTWTMLNYGKVYVIGIELNNVWKYHISKKQYILLNGNITYQKAIDRTDKESKTFNHQIPYTPLFSGSISLSWYNPWFTISYSLIASGKRYTLPQNIPSNEVQPYFDHSISLARDFNLNSSTFSLKAEFLNIANQHYEIIRNYPMQGFGFRFRFIYNFGK